MKTCFGTPVVQAIGQGVASHINAGENAERFRSRFVEHEGKVKLTAVQNSTTASDWPLAINDFIHQTEDHLMDKMLSKALVCNFSTTNPASLVASQLIVMKAFETYFDYEFITLCGIPQVILEGAWIRVLKWLAACLHEVCQGSSLNKQVSVHHNE